MSALQLQNTKGSNRMRTKVFMTGIGIAVLCCLFFCKDKGPTPDDTSGKTVVGTWRYVLPAVPNLIPDTLVITIDIEENDSTFYFELRELNDDTLYWQTGTWDIHTTGGTRDSIFLYGQVGEVIDTSADPDTLTPLPDSLANKTFAIDTTGTSGDYWIIKIKNLEDILVFFISQQIIDMLANSFEIWMERQNEY